MTAEAVSKLADSHCGHTHAAIVATNSDGYPALRLRSTASIGRELADLHVDYESVEQHPLDEVLAIDAPDDPYERYRIDKLAWVSRKDHTAIRYNAHLMITGIPETESDYRVGGRSPLEWVLDRYQVKVDRASGIVNDPNAWLREQNDPRYVVNLIRSLVTVSMETQRLIAELPEFAVIEP